MTLLFSMLDYLGIERERTRVEWVSAAEGAKFAATMNDFVATDHEARREQETGGSEMQEMKRESRKGKRASAERNGRPCARLEAQGEFCLRHHAGNIHERRRRLTQNFVWNDFCGANLSKYLIKEIAQGRQGRSFS